MPQANPFTSLPELRPDAFATTVRVPELRNIALTARVEAIIDHPAFQRLRRIRMLGPTHLVYPGAVHTRFEHSLGVYGCTRWFLQSLGRIPELASSLSEEDLLSVLAAGLLHDIGHYPFAHSLEALHLKGEDTPRHEDVGGRVIMGEFEALCGTRPIAEILRRQWGVDPQRVIRLCTGHLGPKPSQIDRLLHSIISGTIDADKMDYLERDSHHIGVPYGRTYDRERLLANLTLNADESALAIAAKGKVPAEMFVFSRYTMFSEVYWHHTVRAASAMIENAIAAFHSRAQLDPEDFLSTLLSCDDDELLRWLFDQSPSGSAPRFLLGGLQTTHRRLYKRVATFSRIYAERDKQRAYETIYEMERAQLFDLTARLSARLGSALGAPLHPAALIIDIPPRDKDRIDTIDVVYPEVRGRRFYPLHELSQVVAGIQDDFIAVVKKIRIFAEPSLAARLRALDGLDDLLLAEILKR